MRRIAAVAVALCGGWDAPVEAQRTQENTVREAEDGFGKSVGSESIGIYSSGEVRGFSATEAGNNRIEGVYFDRQAQVTNTIVRGSEVRLGLTAFGYPLPAPTGIVDLELRRAGTDPVVSVQLASGDYLGTDLIVDAALPITDRLGINLDLGLYDDQYVSGANGWFVSYGGVARWKPVDGVDVTGFFGRYDYGDEEQAPTIYTATGDVPGRIKRRQYFGQDWADWAGHAQNYGAIVKASFASWQIAAGGFNSRFTRDEYHSAYYDEVDAAGFGRSVMIGGRDQVSASTSGEFRISRVFAEGPRRHRLLASVRARSVEARYGGFDLMDLGTHQIGVPAQTARPDFTYGMLTEDDVRQVSSAVGYELRWPGIGELNAGLTRTNYRKKVRLPNAPATIERDKPWLWNAALALTPFDWLTLYGATTRGLEESGVAPSNAINRGLALPALRTKQYELGGRLAFAGGWRLNGAAFETEKPYFDIDSRDGAFRDLGTVSHRGVEASLSGRPVEQLSIVIGAVAMRPRVSGQSVDDGRIGKRPIGRTNLLVDASADYRFASVAGLSIDTHITYEGRRVANAANSAFIPSRLIVNLGARYRTKAGPVPLLIRPQIRNVGDVFGWKVSSGGGYTLVAGRRLSLTITADF